MTFRQVLCAAWTGHDFVFRFENQPTPLPCRVLLHCTNCDYSTPGLTPATRGPRQTYAGDPRRHQIAPRSFLRLRKWA